MPPDSKYHQSFSAELKKLNPAQKKAVDSLEGPVMVIAGPGTGKTQILSARIGKLLSHADLQVQPHEILCLTYTDAATIAMRERLVSLIGPIAYNLHIYTFHAFCNQIIQENQEYFGFKDLQPVSDLEKFELVEKMLMDLPVNHPLKRFKGDYHSDIINLLKLFSIMQKEGWTPEFISQKIDEYLKGLPDKEEFRYKKKTKDANVGDLKVARIREETEKKERLRSAVFELKNYRTFMMQASRYDYDDMINWVNDGFAKKPDLLSSYQERYQYFLVDEYQDTNGSQNEILKKLVSFWDNPNVFIVGDDDQSIYRFQGANVENMEDFATKYSGSITKITLVENYRSTQKILNTATSFIKRNNKRLSGIMPGIDKNLKASNIKIGSSVTMPAILQYPNIYHEYADLAHEIMRLLENGANPSEIAVIYRQHIQPDPLLKYLNHKKVPVLVKRKENILSAVFIKKIIRLLSYLSKEYEKPGSGNILLFELLHADFFGINAGDIALMTLECHKQKIHLRDMMASRERMFKTGISGIENISRIHDDFTFWTGAIANLTLQGWFEKIITRGGILSFILKSPDKYYLMNLLTAFFDFIKSETAKNPSMHVREFLLILEKMEKHEIALEIIRITGIGEGVNFLTAHGSKGLEFHHVFLIGCTANIWDSAGGRMPFSFPDNLIIKNFSDEEEAEEARRLFYVALTRAKEGLIISFSNQNFNEKGLEKSRYVAELMESDDITFENRNLSEDELVEFQSLAMMEEDAPEIELLDKIHLDELLKKYSLSPTHLSSYIDCPVSFYYKHLIQVPTAKNEALGFGSAIHHALEKIFSVMQKTNYIFPVLTEFITYFHEGMKRNKECFTEAEWKNRIDYGEKILPEYYEKYVRTWHKNVLPEKHYPNLFLDGIPINGIIDKIEIEGSAVNVVDYKTGNVENGIKKLVRPDAETEPYGGDYWRQLVFYKILLDTKKSLPGIVISGEIDFIEKHKKKDDFIKEKVIFTSEDVKFVTNLIKDVYQKIMNREFSKGCGKEECGWCNFVRYWMR
ncbi:MAG: hypothetical protein A3G23_13275 [Bacteroidetes bacterium RIFCSPLOWO2_12_FULL_37_12]|nr:MAG: hypothetical protein A3G23_13275 [Bacteroidetes bacterium RIFCSPLOWO2_12_FULL_37_12]